MAEKTGQYDSLAADIIQDVGGRDNIEEVSLCLTRLRFRLRNGALADCPALKAKREIMDIRDSAGQFQIVIGFQTAEVYQAVNEKLAETEGENRMGSTEKRGFGAKLKGLFAGALSQEAQNAAAKPAAPEAPKKKSEVIASPFTGEVIALEKVEDEAFASGVLGGGLAVIPSEGKVFAPVDGVIETFFPTGHAMGLLSADGVEILIHVGMDTVKLNGEGFCAKAKQGDQVKKGDLLLEFDIDKIKAAGYSTVSPVIVTNSDEYSSITPVQPGNVKAGDQLITANA